MWSRQKSQTENKLNAASFHHLPRLRYRLCNMPEPSKNKEPLLKHKHGPPPPPHTRKGSNPKLHQPSIRNPTPKRQRVRSDPRNPKPIICQPVAKSFCAPTACLAEPTSGFRLCYKPWYSHILGSKHLGIENVGDCGRYNVSADVVSSARYPCYWAMELVFRSFPEMPSTL